MRRLSTWENRQSHRSCRWEYLHAQITWAGSLIGVFLLLLQGLPACSDDDGPSSDSDAGRDALAHRDGGTTTDGGLPPDPLGEVVTFEDGFEPIPITVTDQVNVTRRLAPVSGAIPFARGALQVSDVDRLVLADADSNRRLKTFQTPKVLGTWSDGSVKWLLLDFQASMEPRGSASFHLGFAQAEDDDDPEIAVTEADDHFLVDTGKMRVQINKNTFTLFDQVWVDTNGDGTYDDDEMAMDGPGEMFIDLDDDPPGDADSGAYDYPDDWYLGMEGGNWLRASQSATVTRYLASKGDYDVSLYRDGKSHVIFKMEGWHRSETGDRQFAKYTIYLHFYLGQSFVRLTHTWIMTGDPDKNFIRRMALDFPLAAASHGQDLEYAFGGPFEREGEPVLFDPEKPPYVPIEPGPSELFEGTVGSDGQVSLFSIGPDKYYHDVPLGDAPPVDFTLLRDGEVVTSGIEPSGWGGIRGDTVAVTAGVRDFWREHPKEIQFTNGRLGIYIWPDHGDKTLDLRRRYPEVRGTVSEGWGKAARREFVAPGSAVGVAKTTDLYVSFAPASRSWSVTDDEFRSFQDPLLPFVSGQYNVSTGVFGPIVAYDPVHYEKVERYMDMMAARIVRSRREYRWVGMMDFGDYLTEFEKQNWELDIPDNPDLYSNWGYAGWLQENYRFGQFAFIQYFRSGRYVYFRSASEWLRHTRDVDCVYWDTPDDGDRPPDNQGSLRLGGGHRHDQQHWGTYMAGYGIPTIAVVHHYFMTGEPRDLDAMRDNVTWILDAGSWVENYSPYSVLYMAEALGDDDAMSRALARSVTPRSAYGRATYDSGMGLMMHDIQTNGDPEVRALLKTWADLDELTAGYLRAYLESVEGAGTYRARIEADFDTIFPPNEVREHHYAGALRMPSDFRDAMSTEVFAQNPWEWPIRTLEWVEFDGPGGMGNDLGRTQNQMALLWYMPLVGKDL